MEHVDRRAVRRRKERIVDEYDPRVQEIDETVDGERLDRLREDADDRIGSAYVWVVREPDDAPDLSASMPAVEEGPRALMILGRGGHRWGLPGGGHEDDETYEETARRELREEVGIEATVTDCFLLRHTRTTAPDRETTLHTLWAFLDADYAGGALSIQPGELSGAAWFGRPPERMAPENEFRAADFWTDYDAEDPLADVER